MYLLKYNLNLRIWGIHAQPANSPPQLPSEILDIGKLLKLSVELKKLSREQIHRILMAEPSADPSPYPRIPVYPCNTCVSFSRGWNSIHGSIIAVICEWCVSQIIREGGGSHSWAICNQVIQFMGKNVQEVLTQLGLNFLLKVIFTLYNS